ncbi:hypothetical protein, partial [Clostridioides difficile]
TEQRNLATNHFDRLDQKARARRWVAKSAPPSAEELKRGGLELDAICAFFALLLLLPILLR